MELYRIQNKDNFGGLWYDIDGTSNRLVDQLTDKRLAQLPMEPDYGRYHANGKRWQCAAWDIEHLNHWFSLQDFIELRHMGCIAMKFQASEYIVEENQVLFTLESITDVTDITDEILKLLK